MPTTKTHRKGEGGVEQLLLQSGHVVSVHVRVPQHDDELPRGQAGHMGEQAREQRVAGDVEGYSQAHVGAPLHHLARQLPLRHVELHTHARVGGRVGSCASLR